MVTTTELDCDGMLGEPGDALPTGSGVDGGSLTSIGYVDGLGRARAALATGPDLSGARRWVRSGLSRLSRKGEVIEAYQPDFFGGSDTSYGSVVAINYAMPSSRAVYDAFGRARYAFAEDGSLNVTSYHALSTDVCDPLDNDPSSPHAGTCTTARTDGHGRLIDQILRNRPIDNPFAGLERHRLWTFYRADGAVVTLVRAQTSDENPRPATRALALTATPSVHRDFFYDSINRRIGSDDPDTDDPTNTDPASRTWRYLFNRVGDLVAVRDPRGCGQNFFYDLGGRLLGEEYVSCGEAQSAEAEQPAYDISGDAIALGPIGAPRAVDVAYFYDEYPDWVGTGIDPPAGASGVLGRATGVADRGQRSAVAYDDRGNAIWTARQMAFISAAISGDEDARLTDGRPTFAEGGVTSGTLSYDESHTYVRTATFDHAARPVSMTLPDDPDWDPAGIDPSPPIAGRLEYDRRGLPARALLRVGSLPEIPVVAAIEYLRDGLVSHIEYGELDGSPVIESLTDYDVRRRPVRMSTTRAPDPGALTPDLEAVSVVHDQRLEWDAASNLTALVDERLPIEWPDGFRPQTVEITHDSLYRVVGALFHYSTVDSDDADDTASDWRSEAAASNAVDPMRPEPAAMVGSASIGDRVRSLTWEWDWLGNMTEWTDDAQQFYERSIGAITNGQDIAARPSALYVSSNLEEVGDGGGWVEVDYGLGGNVTSLTVHGECVAGAGVPHGTGRVAALSGAWVCAAEQHFEYRWDELNRIVEARRWDGDGTGAWTFEARQRYRYDGANQRTVKESFDTSIGDSRVALYVYPGDFERRGLTRGAGEYEGFDNGTVATETQYLVAGARLVWDHAPLSATGDLDRNRRLTMGVSDLIHTTAASVDLLSGELLEVSTYYPNGARETLRTNSGAAVPLEPMGFTGKEADEDVGLVYFGERYLLARLGRWASSDPLHVHASGGGEALNSYHYVSGNLLQARDPLGLEDESLGDWLTTVATTAAADIFMAPVAAAEAAFGTLHEAVDDTAATVRGYDDIHPLAGFAVAVVSPVMLVGEIILESGETVVEGLEGTAAHLVTAVETGDAEATGHVVAFLADSAIAARTGGRGVTHDVGEVVSPRRTTSPPGGRHSGGGRVHTAASRGPPAAASVVEDVSSSLEPISAPAEAPITRPDRLLPADAGPGEPAVGTGTAGYRRPGRSFTRAGRREVTAEAGRRSAPSDDGAGVAFCEECGTETTPSRPARTGSRHHSTERQIDHIIPESRGGDGHPSNGRVLCRHCNGSRGNRWP